MLIGERLRILREERNLTQGDMERRTGLLRNYTSRVENSHQVPSVETLEKYARAFGLPTYMLFYDEEEPPKPRQAKKSASGKDAFGCSGKDRRYFERFRFLLGKISPEQRQLLLRVAEKMATK